jgi:hypothetical protein
MSGKKRRTKTTRSFKTRDYLGEKRGKRKYGIVKKKSS